MAIPFPQMTGDSLRSGMVFKTLSSSAQVLERLVPNDEHRVLDDNGWGNVVWDNGGRDDNEGDGAFGSPDMSSMDKPGKPPDRDSELLDIGDLNLQDALEGPEWVQKLDSL